MWPKVFAQLVELLPHVSRLIPMADKFFASKSASEKTTEAAMTAMATDVRTDLGHVAAAHAGLYRQLQEQNAKISEVGTDAYRARVAIESQADRIVLLEQQVAGLGVWIKTVVLLLVAVLAGLIAILLRH